LFSVFSVTGISLGSPVLPLVIVNIKTGASVSTFASPFLARSTYGRSLS
jgi:hypothetical protein